MSFFFKRFPAGESGPRRWWQRPFLFESMIVAGVLAVLALGVLVVPRIPAIRHWRADQLGRQALEALATQDWSVAQQKAAAAFQLAPGRSLPLRAVAQWSALAHDPRTLALYQQLTESPDADAEDFLGYAEAALSARNYRVFESAIDRAGKLLPDDPRVNVLLGRYALLAGDYSMAANFFQLAVIASKEAPERILELSALLLNSPDESTRTRARENLEAIAAAHSDFKIQALGLIVRAQRLPPAVRISAARQLLAQPELPYVVRLGAVETLISLAPDERSRLLAELKNPKDEVEKRELGAFLVRIGENQAALDLLPLAQARLRKDYFLVWLDAAAGLGHWDEVIAALRNEATPLEPALRDLYIGRYYQGVGQKATSDNFYEKAITGADNELLFYFAGYFQHINELPFAEKALRKLISDAGVARPAFEALIGIYRSRKDTDKLLAVLEEMALFYPSDLAVAGDCIYLQLLKRKGVAAALIAASAAPYDRFFALKINLALALLRNDRAAEGLALFENSPVEVRQLLPHQQAVFAALLAANVMREGARDIADKIDRANLLPEELALLP